MSGLQRQVGIVVLGASGHAAVLLDAIELASSFAVIGLVDDTLEPGTIRRGYSVPGGFHEIQMVCSRHSITNAVIAIGDNWQRRKVYQNVSRVCPNLQFPIIRHPLTTVAASAVIENGTVVLAGSHLGPGTKVGKFCIINTGGSLDHDCIMADFASIAPGVFAGGNVKIGECSAVGIGACISHRISIGAHSVIGTGAVVVTDVPDLAVAYGNPARVRRSRKQGEAYL
jgi:sugar O-acyltransferase (sialic acid O-acetyltransferase NeuD family)